MAAGQALQAGLVGDAALAVGVVGAQRQGDGQGAALQAAGLTGAQLGGRPEGRGQGGWEGQTQETINGRIIYSSGGARDLLFWVDIVVKRIVWIS